MDAWLAFRHPYLLLLLVAPALLLLWTWTRSDGVALPFDGAPRRRGRVLAVALRAAESLPALLVAIAVVLLAGPQAWGEPKSKRVLTNIQFCVDVSGSMGLKLGEGSRYDLAMEAINTFVDRREGDAFGLTFFGVEVLHWVPLTTDTSAFKCAPPFMTPGRLPSWFGGTYIGNALRACRKVLNEREEGDKMIVLVTDGYSADLAGGEDEEIARQLEQDGIVVMTVHAAEGDIPEEVARIAAQTGGEAFKTDNPAALEACFAKIDSMVKTRMVKAQAEAADDYVLWSLAGLVVLALALLAALGLRANPW
ncbi:MAG: hypothetical protein RL112_410 [Planctomycetota bacterium]